MEKELICLQMEIRIMDSIRMENLREKGNTLGRMEITMKDNLEMG